MITKGNVAIGLETRFGLRLAWPAMRYKASTSSQNQAASNGGCAPPHPTIIAEGS